MDIPRIKAAQLTLQCPKCGAKLHKAGLAWTVVNIKAWLRKKGGEKAVLRGLCPDRECEGVVIHEDEAEADSLVEAA